MELALGGLMFFAVLLLVIGYNAGQALDPVQARLQQIAAKPGKIVPPRCITVAWNLKARNVPFLPRFEPAMTTQFLPLSDRRYGFAGMPSRR